MTGSRAGEGSPGTRRATWLRGLTPRHGCTTVLPCRIERGERGAQGQFFPFPFIFMDEPSLMRVTENEGMECLNHTEWGCPAGVGACGGGDRASWSHRARTPPRGAGLRRQAPTPAGCFSSGSVCGDPAPSPLRVAGLAAPASGCGVAVPDTRPRPPFASAAVLTAEPRAADPPLVLPPKVRVKAKQRATGTLRRLRTSSAARGTDAEKKPGEARLSPRRPARAWRRRLEFARKGSSLSKRRTPCRVTCAEAMVSPTLPSGTGSKARSGSLPAAGDARCPPPPPPRPLGHAAATVLGTKPSGVTHWPGRAPGGRFRAEGRVRVSPHKATCQASSRAPWVQRSPLCHRGRARGLEMPRGAHGRPAGEKTDRQFEEVRHAGGQGGVPRARRVGLPSGPDVAQRGRWAPGRSHVLRFCEERGREKRHS